MMRRYRKGQLWRPPTAAESAANADATEGFRRRPPLPLNRQVGIREPDIIWVRNSEEVDWDVFDVVELTEIIISPEEIDPRIFFDACTPTADHAGRLAILLSPVNQDGIGPAVLSGAVQTRVNISDTDHQYATAAASSRRLISTDDSSSACQILWPRSSTPDVETGDQPAVVRLSNPSTLQLVTVAKDGGVAGGEETDCTFTYTITDLSGAELETGLTPEKARIPTCTYIAGGEGDQSDYGLAAFVNGAWILLEAYGEVPDPNVCP